MNNVHENWLFKLINEKQHEDNVLSIWNELSHYRHKTKFQMSRNKKQINVLGNKYLIEKSLNLKIDKSSQDSSLDLNLQDWYQFNYVDDQKKMKEEIFTIFFENELTLELLKSINSGNIDAIVLNDASFDEEEIQTIPVFNIQKTNIDLGSFIYKTSTYYRSKKKKKLIYINKIISSNFQIKSNEILKSQSSKDYKSIRFKELIYEEVSNLINKLWLQNDIEAIELIGKILIPTNLLFEKIDYIVKDLNFDEIEKELQSWMKKITVTY